MGQFHFVPAGSPPPGRPLVDVPGPSRSSESPPTSEDSPSEMKVKRTSWSTVEVKMLIQSYKDNHTRLQSSKSSKGKKSIWEVLFQEFVTSCCEAKVKTTKTLAQCKEKWRALFEKY